MMFTSKLVLCQYCKPFIEVIYALEILDVTGNSGWRQKQINNLFRTFSRAVFESHRGRAQELR